MPSLIEEIPDTASGTNNDIPGESTKVKISDTNDKKDNKQRNQMKSSILNDDRFPRYLLILIRKKLFFDKKLNFYS